MKYSAVAFLLALSLGGSASLLADGGVHIALTLPEESQLLLEDDRYVDGIPIRLESSEVSGETSEVLCYLNRPCLVTLKMGSEWLISSGVEGLWSPVLKIGPVTRPQESATITLPIFPSARIQGQLTTYGHSEELPRSLDVRISWPSASAEKRRPPLISSEIQIPVAVHGRFSISVPASTVDVRLWASSFVPFYLWDLDLLPGSLKSLKTLKLSRGASLVGWIQVDKATPGGELPRLYLSPLAQGLTDDVQGLKRRSIDASTTPPGFFQLTGMPPGSYVLKAVLKGHGEGSSPPITLLEGTETELPDPLVLLPPSVLELEVLPATDAYNQPWQVLLKQETLENPGFLETVDHGTIGEGGVWRSTPLRSAEYTLRVQDSQGSVWIDRSLELVSAFETLFIEIPLIPVEGKVHLGDDPATGRIWFGGRRRRPNIALELGTTGEFAGYLPREGEWELDLETEQDGLEQAIGPVTVEISDGQGVARVEVRLPDTELTVRTIDEAGTVIPRVPIVVLGKQGEKTRREAMTRTNDEGTFTFRGLEPGEVSLRARKATAESEEVSIVLQERIRLPEVTLQLREHLKVSGRVSRNGNGIPGATIFVLMEQPLTRKQVTAGVSGLFELNVPAGNATVAAFAAGYGLRVLPISFSKSTEEGVLEIPLAPQPGHLVIDLREAVANKKDVQNLTLVASSQTGGGTLPFSDLFFHLGVPTEGSKEPILEIPATEPGTWSLCAGPSQCSSGFLSPSGSLVLTYPESDKVPEKGAPATHGRP